MSMTPVSNIAYKNVRHDTELVIPDAALSDQEACFRYAKLLGMTAFI